MLPPTTIIRGDELINGDSSSFRFQYEQFYIPIFNTFYARAGRNLFIFFSFFLEYILFDLFYYPLTLQDNYFYLKG